MADILEWENISFAYGSGFEVSGVSHALEEGEFTLFFGPNGAGKTTLFKLGTGLLKPTHGRVILGGRSLDQMKAAEIAKQVAYLEQEIQYLFPFTVEEVVLMGRFPHTASQFWDRKEDFEIAVWAMELTGVLKFAKRSVFQLSSGERRRVEIARAICQKPNLLFLDEPTTFMDVRQQVDLFELLSRLNQENRITVAMISHQLGLAKNFVKSAVFVKDGRIVEKGASGQMLSREKIAEYFGFASSEALRSF